MMEQHPLPIQPVERPILASPYAEPPAHWIYDTQSGAALRTPVSVFDSGRTMAVHFYILAREGISMPNAYGTAAILMVSILLINLVAYTLMQRMMRRFS